MRIEIEARLGKLLLQRHNVSVIEHQARRANNIPIRDSHTSNGGRNLCGHVNVLGVLEPALDARLLATG